MAGSWEVRGATWFVGRGAEGPQRGSRGCTEGMQRNAKYDFYEIGNASAPVAPLVFVVRVAKSRFSRG